MEKSWVCSRICTRSKKRGLSCGVYSSISSNFRNSSDWKVCDEADSGKPEWIKEAKYRIELWFFNFNSFFNFLFITSIQTEVCDEVKLKEWLESQTED